MSNIYIQEPPTNGKVIMYTTVGDIEIELWSKETPLACRNFVQLCLEGYYNQTIFHRLAPNFVVQGGDPSGTGFGGESIYGEPFRNEPHSRLRFMRRGLLATANNGDNHSNGSQFFFTLDATPDLQNKHTIFGKAVGTTLFNMLKLGESEIDANERPVYLNKILKTEVVINPFDDIVPRSFASDKPAEAPVDSKAKATKNFGLLSFGEEAEEEEEETEATISEFRTVSKSLHDVVDDPKMSSQSVLSEPIEESTSDELQSVQQRLRKAEAERLDELEAEDAQREATKNATSNSRVDTLRQQALQLQKELTRTKVKDIPLEARTVKAVDAAVVDYKKGMEIYESRRRKAKNKEGDKRDDREATTLAKLKAFQSTLHAVRIDGEESPAVQSQLAADSEGLEEAEEDITGLNWYDNVGVR
ncbi:hypothetical protein RvY_18757-2 [Ramazzottius varieornatus]|uniref:Spliceosome-associated protein CWC27 homolog n=1 Tax=Ramazzottius varieornatus TaxID=947166 RepID=A0A1D1W773_RAMVA|nr:hypothetical protein RvY_18757-2 [Ramazzottius varieornatus]